MLKEKFLNECIGLNWSEFINKIYYEFRDKKPSFIIKDKIRIMTLENKKYEIFVNNLEELIIVKIKLNTQRDYKKENKKQKELNIRFNAKINNDLANKFKTKLKQENKKFSIWLKEEIIKYLEKEN